MSVILDKFIVFEGLDGAGTTTQMRMLAEAFDRAQISCHATFEPTNSSIGALVREILRKEKTTTPLALAMLFAADREDHLNHAMTGILARLQTGATVVCDRYVHSSLAYQSVECGFERIQELNAFPLPRFLFYIDTPVEDCLKRIDGRSNERELFERQEFLAKVRDNYAVLFAQLPEQVTCNKIDGRLSKQDIHDTVAAVLRAHALL